MKRKRPTFILNEQAGSDTSGGIRALIARVAEENGAEARILVSEGGDDLPALAKEACAAGELVAAGGGDGTVATVAAALVDTDAVLGVLPMGTLNHFAKDLRIPLDMEAAVRTLFSGEVARVDVGEVNGRIFINNSSIGFYPQIVRERERQQRRGRGKWAALASATASVFRRSRTLDVELEVEGASRPALRTPLVFVGNNRYEVSGLEIGTRKVLDAGSLWVCTAPHAGRLELIRSALTAFLGLHGSAELASFDTTDAILRPGQRHLQVATDGEVVMMRSPLHYRIRPGALRVVVPAQAERD